MIGEKYPRYYKNAVHLSTNQIVWLKKYFPEHENSVLMEATGLTHAALHRFARVLGLKKSEEGMKGIRQRQAEHIRKVCEANGYYESLRGKKPSQNALDAYQRYLRSERYKHPLRKMREDNPEAYEELLRKRREMRKQLIEDEKRRIKWGYPRKTRLKLYKEPYTRSQTQRRYGALKRGYILGDRDVERMKIFYDKNTARSEKVEDGMRKDGFEVLPLPVKEEEYVKAVHDWYNAGSC